MARIAYFDCFSGISGDMALGALIHAGVDVNDLKSELHKVHFHADWDLSAHTVVKRGISATSVEITVRGDRAHHGPHHQGHPPIHGSHDLPGRSFAEIRQTLRLSQLDEPVASESIAVFARIAAAEARIHGATVEDVHFHELGGIDSIIDIVGAVIGLRMLSIEKCYCSPLPLSHGTITCAHGTYPIPAPAVTELLKGATFIPTEIEGELITPTGAGLLAHFTEGFAAPPAFSVESVGWGAGEWEYDRPNVLRLVVGNTAQAGASPGPDISSGLLRERLHVLEANIDDMSPQHYEMFMERAFERGALDVCLTPVQMKKTRPGVLLSVLCKPELTNDLLRIFFRETTTLGARVQEIDRFSLPRELLTVHTPHGEVRVKIGKLDEEVVHALPEYDDCRRIAEQEGLPVQEVHNEALHAARREFLVDNAGTTR
ncbi:MAG: TIGR00299 family protein [Armatimonadetes bacterium CG2_30_59_28]|nr:nickel pincer cofactor biosynthesis protein LarC [Armatimonadota bacterium]OIO93348.1 MAG: TIGR00299 family protein [Armatimonadetes bacterium CG2_30_59_28]